MSVQAHNSKVVPVVLPNPIDLIGEIVRSILTHQNKKPRRLRQGLSGSIYPA